MCFISILLFSACSQHQSAATGHFVLSYAVEDVPAAGGVFVKAENIDDELATPLFLQLDSEGNVEIPYGNWNIYVVAFAGPTFLDGEMQCGSIEGQRLDAPEVDFTLDVESSTCSTTSFITIVDEIKDNVSAKWDSAIWDKSVWGQ